MRRNDLNGKFLPRRVVGLTASALLAACLAGCVDTLPQVQGNVAPAQNASRIAARPGVSPAGATVAFVNLGGAPAQVGARFAVYMSQALGARNISSDEAAKANYLIRGDMSAYATDAGIAVAYVWDVYDSGRRRMQRVEDEIIIKGNAADPWSVVDEKTLATIAGRSADEIAAFLTHTPEAIAAAGRRGEVVATDLAPTGHGGSGAGTLAYSPQR